MSPGGIHMRPLSSLRLVLALAFALTAHANQALHGTWSTAIDGQPLVVTFEANNAGKVNGVPMQWGVLGRLLFVQQQGAQMVTYSYEVKGDKLNVAGGDLAGMITLERGTAAADAAKAKQAAAKPAAGPAT